jgi:hypothetical protein
MAASGTEVQIVGYMERTDDAAAWPPTSGAVATVSALVSGEDYREPYWTRGGRFSVTHQAAPFRARALLAWESWTPASLEANDVIEGSYRPVRELDEGEAIWASLEFERPPEVAVEAVGGGTWAVRVEGATSKFAGDFSYLQATLRGDYFWPTVVGAVGVRVNGAAGAVAGDLIPSQRLFPTGGRGTVRGYAFHRYIGNLYGAAGVELSGAIRYPFVSLAVFGDIGWAGTEGDEVDRAIGVWNRVGAPAGPAPGALLGVGAGVGLVYDVIWLELARGVTQNGLWEFVFRVRSEFWGWL